MECRERDMLRLVCRSVTDSSPTYKVLLGESLDESADVILDEISQLLEAVNERQQTSMSAACDVLQPVLTVLEVCAVQLFDLTLLSRQRDKEGRAVFWPEMNRASDTDPNIVLDVFATNLFHNLLAIRDLVCRGWDNQARILLRSHLELANLFVAVAGNVDVYHAYLRVGKDMEGSRDDWAKYLSPGKIRREVARIEHEIGIDGGAIREFHDIRGDVYSWLSQFTHGNYVSMCLGAYPAEMARLAGDEEATEGRITQDCRDTLAHASLYTWLLLLTIARLLRTLHGWSFSPEENAGIWFLYRLEVLRSLFLLLYNDLWSTPPA